MISEHNPSAFPLAFEHEEGHEAGISFGMTLRDYFAAKAMQALIMQISAADMLKYKAEDVRKMVAHGAYAQADEMLSQRQKVEVER